MRPRKTWLLGLLLLLALIGVGTSRQARAEGKRSIASFELVPAEKRRTPVKTKLPAKRFPQVGDALQLELIGLGVVLLVGVGKFGGQHARD